MRKEQIWAQYKRAVRVQYVITLLALHRLGFGHKRLVEFEEVFGDLVSQINDFSVDGVFFHKLEPEFKQMGYNLNDLLKNYTESNLTFSEMQHQERNKEKMQLAERIEVAKKLKESGFYSGKMY